jgi:CP family cyanate transporter-like MFS transporter
LLIAGVVSGLRGAVLNISVLYTATIVMSAGIAVMQPALSPLVRQWLPQRVTFGTAVYTNGLLVGETLAVMLTIPLMLPLAGGSWRWALAIWGIPLVVIAILAVALAPATKEAPSSAAVAGRNWWPDFSNKLIWQVGILFGSVNSVYFSGNAFLPGHAFHRLRWAHARVRHWPCHDRKRMDHRFCRRAGLPHRRRAHARLCTAAAVERARRRGTHVGGNVYDQL